MQWGFVVLLRQSHSCGRDLWDACFTAYCPMKKCGISATGGSFYSFYGCKDHIPDRTKGEMFMPDDFIRRMIQAVIESFSIDEAKKADILRSIVGQEKIEEDQ